jgi:hypothetical protein
MEKRFLNNLGFLDVNQYDKSIPKHSENMIEPDDSMKPLLEKIEEVIEEFLDIFLIQYLDVLVEWNIVNMRRFRCHL